VWKRLKLKSMEGVEVEVNNGEIDNSKANSGEVDGGNGGNGNDLDSPWFLTDFSG
jgi:hypothetical protein